MDSLDGYNILVVLDRQHKGMAIIRRFPSSVAKDPLYAQADLRRFLPLFTFAWLFISSASSYFPSLRSTRCQIVDASQFVKFEIHRLVQLSAQAWLQYHGQIADRFFYDEHSN